MNYPPTPEEIRAYFDEHNLSRRKVADLLNVGDRTVSYWKSGEVEMPYSAWYTLRSKIEGKSPQE